MPHHDPCNDFLRSLDCSIMEVHSQRVPAADAAIVLRYEAAVRRFCRSRTRSEADADDAVQDTFMRFLRRSEERIRSHEAWLITAASRACSDINRKHQRDEQHLTGLPRQDITVERDSNESFSDQGRNDPAKLTADHLTVSALLRRMNDRDRMVVTHLYLLGATPEQVGRYIGASANTVRQIAFRARRHARALLAETDVKNESPVTP